MLSLFITESVVHVILKSLIHFFQIQCCIVIQQTAFLQIANTGIKLGGEGRGRERGDDWGTGEEVVIKLKLRLQFLQHWHIFTQNLNTSLPIMVLLLCLCFDTWLAHNKMLGECTTSSHFTVTSQGLQRPKWEIECKKFHSSCFTYLSTHTLFSFPQLILVISSPWWAISFLMTRMNTVRSMYRWRLISIPTKYLLVISLKSYLKSKSSQTQKLLKFKSKQDSQISGIIGLIL